MSIYDKNYIFIFSPDLKQVLIKLWIVTQNCDNI